MTPALAPAPVVRRSFGRLLTANVSMSIAFASVIYRFRRPPSLPLSLAPFSFSLGPTLTFQLHVFAARTPLPFPLLCSVFATPIASRSL